MVENALFMLVRSTLLPLLATQGLGDLVVQQGWQSTQQSRPTGRFIYFEKVGPTQQVGSPKRRYKVDPSTKASTQIMVQPVLTTYQVGCIINSDPSNLTELSAADILQTTALLMQSDIYLATLLAQNVNVLRVQNIPIAAGQNDRQQWEIDPSFDITLSHVETLELAQPIVTGQNFKLLRV